jgi:hypothetical protein
MPIRHVATANIIARFVFACSIRFNLKDNSDYEKTVLYPFSAVMR